MYTKPCSILHQVDEDVAMDEGRDDAEKNAEDEAQAVDAAGKTEHDSMNVQQNQASKDSAGQNDDDSEEVRQCVSLCLGGCLCMCVRVRVHVQALRNCCEL